MPRTDRGARACENRRCGRDIGRIAYRAHDVTDALAVTDHVRLETSSLKFVEEPGVRFRPLGDDDGVRRSLRIGDTLYAVGPSHISAMKLTSPDQNLGSVDL